MPDLKPVPGAPSVLKINHQDIQKVPPIFSNIFNVAVTPTHVRITFGEVIAPPGVTFRTAVVMLKQDAQALVDSVSSALKRSEESDKKLPN
jgi:hypothetical protein